MEEDFFEEPFNDSPKFKLAVIAGASEALRLKKDWKRMDDDIIQEITKNVEVILKKID